MTIRSSGGAASSFETRARNAHALQEEAEQTLLSYDSIRADPAIVHMALLRSPLTRNGRTTHIPTSPAQVGYIRLGPTRVCCTI